MLFTTGLVGGFFSGVVPFASIGIVTELAWGLAGFLSVPIGIVAVLSWPPLLISILSKIPLLNASSKGIFSRLLEGIFVGLAVSLLVGMGSSWFYGWVLGVTTSFSRGLSYGVSLGFGYARAMGLLLVFVGGLALGFKRQKGQENSLPNHSIRQSRRNAIVFVAVGVFGGFIFALMLWYYNGQILGLQNMAYLRYGRNFRAAIIAGVPIGLLLGYSVSFVYGGNTVITHYILRIFLSYSKQLPFVKDKNFVDFLNHMKDHIILRREGGGWQFIHRYLLEYFAELSQEDITQLASEIESSRS
jgi:hypothetical protein